MPIHRSTVSSPHKDQWRGALMFSFICVWINSWVNNCEAGDLRRYRAHDDVIVMQDIYSYDINTVIPEYSKVISRGINISRPRQDGRHFPDDIFKCIFLNENAYISIKISLKFVSRGPINNIPALVQIMAWRRPGDKPLSEPMMVSLLTHICVTRPQWVKQI